MGLMRQLCVVAEPKFCSRDGRRGTAPFDLAFAWQAGPANFVTDRRTLRLADSPIGCRLLHPVPIRPGLARPNFMLLVHAVASTWVNGPLAQERTVPVCSWAA